MFQLTKDFSHTDLYKRLKERFSKLNKGDSYLVIPFIYSVVSAEDVVSTEDGLDIVVKFIIDISESVKVTYVLDGAEKSSPVEFDEKDYEKGQPQIKHTVL